MIICFHISNVMYSYSTSTVNADTVGRLDYIYYAYCLFHCIRSTFMESAIDYKLSYS